MFLCSYLLIWSRKASSCCFSVAVIISSTSVSCSGSAPLACRDARMASIRWDFSSRRLSVKQTTNQTLICDRVWARRVLRVHHVKWSWFPGHDELTCSLWTQTAVALWGWRLSARKERMSSVVFEPEPRRLREAHCVLPCSSSEAAFLQWGAGWRCKDRKYEREQSPESLGFPEEKQKCHR